VRRKAGSGLWTARPSEMRRSAKVQDERLLVTVCKQDSTFMRGLSFASR
jgi:hypothetical protein